MALTTAAKFRRWMGKQGYSPRGLAEEIGVTRSAVRWWMEGTHVPKVTAALRIEALGGPRLTEWSDGLAASPS